MARECGLSVNHYTRAFKKGFGNTRHSGMGWQNEASKQGLNKMIRLANKTFESERAAREYRQLTACVADQRVSKGQAIGLRW
jgi:AraC-like DNA-binding protein